MAYDTKELEQKSLEVATKHNCIFIDDIIAYLGISKQTFYDHNLDHFDDLKKIIEKNRINLKVTLRKKWLESNNPTTEICLYKLLATETEHKLLSNTQRNENVNLNIGINDLKENYTAEDIMLGVKEFERILTK